MRTDNAYEIRGSDAGGVAAIEQEPCGGSGTIQERERRLTKVDEWLCETVINIESIAPGLVFGTVDVVCSGCGVTSCHKYNADGSNTYICPACGVEAEV